MCTRATLSVVRIAAVNMCRLVYLVYVVQAIKAASCHPPVFNEEQYHPDRASLMLSTLIDVPLVHSKYITSTVPLTVQP